MHKWITGNLKYRYENVFITVFSFLFVQWCMAVFWYSNPINCMTVNYVWKGENLVHKLKKFSLECIMFHNVVGLCQGNIPLHFVFPMRLWVIAGILAFWWQFHLQKGDGISGPFLFVHTCHASVCWLCLKHRLMGFLLFQEMIGVFQARLRIPATRMSALGAGWQCGLSNLQPAPLRRAMDWQLQRAFTLEKKRPFQKGHVAPLNPLRSPSDPDSCRK